FDHAPAEAQQAAALAKAHITERAQQVARDAVEAHGGIGFTWECDVHIWFKRVMFDRSWLGAPALHRGRFAAGGGWVSASGARSEPKANGDESVNLSFGEKYEKLRAEVRAFCAGSWPPRGDEARLAEREQAIAWRKRAIAAGYLHQTVPRAYGGAGADPDVMATTVIRPEVDRAGGPHRGNVQ